MTWQDYKRTIRGRKASIGILDGQYVMEWVTQSGMCSNFYKISKEEYDRYEEWKDNEDAILDLRLRGCWYVGFFGNSEFRLKEE